jgi:hypothetical protein
MIDDERKTMTLKETQRAAVLKTLEIWKWQVVNLTEYKTNNPVIIAAEKKGETFKNDCPLCDKFYERPISETAKKCPSCPLAWHTTEENSADNTHIVPCEKCGAAYARWNNEVMSCKQLKDCEDTIPNTSKAAAEIVALCKKWLDENPAERCGDHYIPVETLQDGMFVKLSGWGCDSKGIEGICRGVRTYTYKVHGYLGRDIDYEIRVEINRVSDWYCLGGYDGRVILYASRVGVVDNFAPKKGDIVTIDYVDARDSSLYTLTMDKDAIEYKHGACESPRCIVKIIPAPKPVEATTKETNGDYDELPYDHRHYMDPAKLKSGMLIKMSPWVFEYEPSNDTMKSEITGVIKYIYKNENMHEWTVALVGHEYGSYNLVIKNSNSGRILLSAERVGVVDKFAPKCGDTVTVNARDARVENEYKYELVSDAKKYFSGACGPNEVITKFVPCEKKEAARDYNNVVVSFSIARKLDAPDDVLLFLACEFNNKEVGFYTARNASDMTRRNQFDSEGGNVFEWIMDNCAKFPMKK